MIRLLLPEDHALCREVRLRALATDPQVFSSNLEREAAYPEAHWRERLADPAVGVFGLFKGPAIVGMTGVIQLADDPNTRLLVSHRRSNVRSMRANQRFGFLPTHVTPHTWPDGTDEDQLHYALAL